MTAKSTTKTTTKPASKAAAVAAPKPVMTGPLKPIKTEFKKTTLIAHLASTAAVDPKAVKAVMAALEATIAASVAKKGVGTFTMPGLLKIMSVHVPAKKARIGIDPFTKQERKFAAKPATTKIKVRAMKKLKDAALS
jgi:nucleoid DNA-binding protein